MGGGLPSGRLTFVFTDIEGSTEMFHRLGERYPGVLADHYRLLRGALARHGGIEVRTAGDAMFVVFTSPAAALEACADAQVALGDHQWPDDGIVKVRMGAHTGEAQAVDGDYVSLAVHQASRVTTAARGGQVLASDATAEAVRGVALQGAELVDMGEFWLKDFPQPQRLWHVRIAGPFSGDLPAPRAPSATATNLPRPRTSFVGRDDERQLLLKLLAEHQIVTVLGPGGVGKTRLAVEAAGELAVRFPDGVWLVELAGVSDPQLIVPAAATAMGIGERAGKPQLELIREHLEDRRILLMFDNCEHLVDAAAATIDALVSRCPSVAVLATSREPLRISGEQRLRLEPLDLEPSTSLLVDRIRLADPGFEVSDANAGSLATICERLDGIPLAIELAAARVGEIDLGNVARELEDRFDLLTSGLRTAAARQQTLEASIAWSWNLLSDADAVCLRRISILPGGGTEEMAAVIAQGLTGEGDPLSPTATGPALTRLVARSLVARDGGRWKVLESIRAFGLARAEEAGELPELRRRLAGWVVTLARTYTIAVRGRGGDLGEITRQADTEVDNIRGAFSPDVLFLLPEDAGLPGILDYFALRGRAMEAMALVGPLAERENPEALYRMGQFWSVLGDTEQGLAACERGHAELARRSASGRLSHWERACSFQLDAVEARLLAQAGRTEESLAIVSTTVERHADVLDDVDRLVMDALHAALLIDLGRLDDAADLLHHGLALARSLGSSGFVLSNLSNLAVVRLRQENLDEAEMLLHEVLEARESVGDRLGMGSTLLNIADLAIRRGDPARAAACADQAIGIAVDTGRLPLLEIAFRTIAELIVPTDPVRAAHFLGAADKVMDRVGVRPGSQAAEVLPLEANLEASLGAAGLASARASGHARDLDTSIADARAAASAISSG